MLDFMCIGAQKAGTTWLYKQLDALPDITFPLGKEGHYWDWVQNGKRKDPESWYLEKFSDNSVINGDMTPAYATLQRHYVERIQALFPQLKIVFILRNPIERAWSATRMLIENAHLDNDEVTEDWLLTHIRSRAAIHRGDYERTLRTWHEFFSSQQLRIWMYEQILNEPSQVVAEIAHHVGVSNFPENRKHLPSMKVRVKEGRSRPMPETIRATLISLYKAPIARLEAYTGYDLSHWNDISTVGEGTNVPCISR